MIVGAFSIIPALTARRSLEDGKTSLTKAQSLLAQGDLEGSQQQFADAKKSFQEAESAAGSLSLRVEGLVPFFGRTADALHGLTQIGVDVSSAGVDLTSGVIQLPQGLASLAPQQGQLPLDQYAKLQPSIQSARASIEHANDIAQGISSTFVVGPVSEAGTTVRQKLAVALPLVRSADQLLTALPEFAGADGPKHYFVAAQNPAEARGAGGLIGEYAILTLDKGRFSLSKFRDIKELANQPPGSLPPAPKSITNLYGTQVIGNWTSTNMMPDVPTAAGLAEQLWTKTEGGKLDGAIYIDPGALPFLLQATGPIDSKELGTQLTAQSVVDFVTNQAYFQFGDTKSAQRKEALGVAAGEIWREFLSGAPADKALRALVSAASAGHIMIHSTNPTLENAFRTAGVAGNFASPGGDFLGIADNNAVGSKIDFYMKRTVDYDVTLLSGGNAIATTKVAYTNTAPKGAPESYALTPYPYVAQTEGLVNGENLTIAGMFCAPDCIVGQVTENGKPSSTTPGKLGDLTVSSSLIAIKPGETVTLTYETSLPGVWDGSTASGEYHLRLQTPPMIKPVAAHVTIHVPGGDAVTSSTEKAVVDGSTVTWNGEIGKWTDLDVAFGKPFLSRTWTRVTDFLKKPAINF